MRWLTTEDENQTNFPMFGAGKGNKFVINDQGYILTNRHVAAGWSVSYEADRDFSVGLGFDIENPGRRSPFVFDPSAHPELISWLPERGQLFDPDAPILIGVREFEGRDGRLDVRFPGSPLRLAARLMRTSVEADVAEIKVDAQQPLTTVEISDGRVAPVGEQVTVLGYPYFPKNSQAVIRSAELGDKSQHVELVPEPTVTTGNIALITPAFAAPVTARPSALETLTSSPFPAHPGTAADLYSTVQARSSAFSPTGRRARPRPMPFRSSSAWTF